MRAIERSPYPENGDRVTFKDHLGIKVVGVVVCGDNDFVGVKPFGSEDVVELPIGLVEQEYKGIDSRLLMQKHVGTS